MIPLRKILIFLTKNFDIVLTISNTSLTPFERGFAWETNNDANSIKHEASFLHDSKNYDSLTLQTKLKVKLNMDDLRCLFRDSSYP